MSDDLSRVKSRQKKYKGEGQAPVKGKNRKQAAVSPPKETEAPVLVSGTLSRKARHSSTAAKTSVKHDRAEQEGEDTPSRAQTYPSERIRLSKIFVNSLIVMFVMLLASLFWWGFEGAPELRTLW
ncbi:hypothetical protein NYE80_23310 [Paenibacillus sp. FSL H7-0357]|uniref:hypothetical protein n=1 Tax=unclassified Paenibacillus TaxID=185978 RepID=UPI00056E4F88|nr:hypothetical protein [Paenibacillus sp. FSL H7-0357]